MHDNYIDINREEHAVVVIDDNYDSVVKFVVTGQEHDLKYNTATVKICQNYLDCGSWKDINFTFDSKDQVLAIVKFFQEVADVLYAET